MMHVQFSAYAANRRQDLLDYLASTHSLRLSLAVDTLIDECLDALIFLPRMWPIVESKEFGSVHKATLEGLTLIFYRIESDAIQILDVVDARSDWQ